jgi:hypothetical protein
MSARSARARARRGKVGPRRLAARWSREKEGLQRVAEIKRQIDELRIQAEREAPGQPRPRRGIRYGFSRARKKSSRAQGSRHRW